jgi:RimJ/RimL family protein N-acetyltransferase
MSFGMAKTIETKNLILRQHSIDDINGYIEFWSMPSPKIAGVPGVPSLNPEEAWSRLLRFIGHWSVFDFGPLIITDKETKACMGEAGFAHFNRGHGASFDLSPEAMWKIDYRFQGRGLALEAMQAVAKWFDDHKHMKRTVCMIDPENTASLRIAEHLGFQRFKNTTYRSNPVVLFERLVE